MATLTINKGTNGEPRKVEDIDLATTTVRDLIDEAINCGFLETSPNTNWFAVSNKTHEAIREEDFGKTLDELGFKDNDTIRFVSKGEAAAENGMIISGGNTSEVFQTERLIRNAGIADARTERMLLEKMPIIARFFPSAQQRIIADYKKKSAQQTSDFLLRLSTLSHEAELQALTEKYNAALSVVRGQLRSDVVRFARTKYEEVIRHLDEIQDRDLKTLEQLYKNCQSMTVPAFRAKYEEALSKEFDKTVEFQLKLIDEFVSFLNTKLSVPDSTLAAATR